MAMLNLLGRSGTACPYCFYRIDLNKVTYQCSGRPAPGRAKCELVVDEAQKNVFKNLEPVKPSFTPQGRVGRGGSQVNCPDCGGPTGTRTCPVCHSMLPPAFEAGSPMFGLIGVKASGKTVYLSILVSELLGSVRKRFDADAFTSGDSPEIKRIHDFRWEMQRGGKLPDTTEQLTEEGRRPIVIEWRQQKKGALGEKLQSTILSFYDTAGEDLATSEGTKDVAYLGAADGLILLLDPFQFPANHPKAISKGIPPDRLSAVSPQQVLANVTQMLRETGNVKQNKKIARPLAVVVSKIDAFFDEIDSDEAVRRAPRQIPAFDEHDSRDLHDHVASIVDGWGGGDVLSHLELNYKNYRFFAASALGAEPDYGQATADSQGIRPHRVADPLLWLMAGEGILEKRV